MNKNQRKRKERRENLKKKNVHAANKLSKDIIVHTLIVQNLVYFRKN